MSGGYDTYMCYYYSYEGCPRGYVEVAGNACATCLSMGRGHQGTNSNPAASNTNKSNRERVECALSRPNALSSTFGKTVCLVSTDRSVICKREEGQTVAYPPHHGCYRGRKL